MGGDDDDALYDELYGDDDDAVELPAAPQPKPSGGGFKIPKTAPAPVEERMATLRLNIDDDS